MKCDFCDSENVIQIYAVPTSLIGARVYSCGMCGLKQSFYSDKDKSNKHTDKRISSGASWGNIRHGKSIRLQPSLDVLSDVLDNPEVKNVLDVGSNRGSFVNYLVDNSPCMIDAIEPDSTILDDYKQSNRITVYNEKLEDYLPNKGYDLIYCCHTLEHMDSAKKALQKMVSMLNNNGYLYIDVPSADVLLYKQNVEEFFIDKHTFHFNKTPLCNMLTMLGLDVQFAHDDGFNITILAKLFTKNKKAKETIHYYETTKDNNLIKIKTIAQKMNALCQTNNVLVYGASRIFDALVTHGGLDPSLLAYVVDDYLFGKIEFVHGIKLTRIDNIDFQGDSIDICFILARSSIDSIKEKMLNTGLSDSVKIISIADYL